MRLIVTAIALIIIVASSLVARSQNNGGRPSFPLQNPSACNVCTQFTNAKNAVFAGGVDMIYTNTAVAGLSDSKVVTCAFWIQRNSGNKAVAFEINDNTSLRFRVGIDVNSALTIDGTSAAPSQILQGLTPNNTINTTNWYHVLWVINMADQSSSFCYTNGTLASVMWTDFDNDAIDLVPATPIRAMGNNYSAQNVPLAGALAEFWIDDSYINEPCYWYCNGRPATLSVTGQTPGGQSPAIYLSRVGDGQSWPNDSSGNGNDFSQQIGTLGTGTSP